MEKPIDKVSPEGISCLWVDSGMIFSINETVSCPEQHN